MAFRFMSQTLPPILWPVHRNLKSTDIAKREYVLTVLLCGYVLALATVVKPLRKGQLQSYLPNAYL